jgi:hypothetical protein
MAGQPAKNRVRVTMIRSGPDPDEIQFLRGHRAHRRAILGVVARREHLRGVDRHLHPARRRPGPRSLQLLGRRLEDEQGLTEQRQIGDTIAVLVDLGRSPQAQRLRRAR